MKALDKKLLRDSKSSVGLFFAVAAVIACGIVALVSMMSAYYNLDLTRETYYRDKRFEDLHLVLEKAPESAIARVARIDGVRAVMGRIVKDVPLEVNGEKEGKIARIISYPGPEAAPLNDIHLTGGRYFSSERIEEIVMTPRFLDENRLVIGDSVTTTLNGRNIDLKIVGTALSPEYVYMIRGAVDFMPDFENFCVVWANKELLESAYDMSGAINEVVALTDQSADTDAILDKAGDVLEPYGLLAKIPRKDQISHMSLNNEIKGLKKFAVTSPIIYFLVAAVVINLVIARMVRSQRTQIGTLKSLGYSNIRILGHYVEFSLMPGVLGAVLGIVAGLWLAGAMTAMYVGFFEFPVLKMRFHPGVIFSSIGLSLGFCAAGGAFAARRALAITPAESLHPEPPAAGKRIFIENMPIIWKRLPITLRIIIRTVARHPVRACISAGGIALSAGLFFYSMISYDSWEYLVDRQFSQVERDDAKVSFFTELDMSAYREIARVDGVVRAEPVAEWAVQARNGWRKKTIVLTGLRRGDKLRNLLDSSDVPVELPRDGVALCERLATQLGVGVGDHLRIEPVIGAKKEKDLPVRAVFKEHFGLSAYLDIDYLSHLAGESSLVTSVLLAGDKDEMPELRKRLGEVPAVGSIIEHRKMIESIDEQFGEMLVITFIIMMVFSGIITFAVVYASSAISISERSRELASLIILGLKRSEVMEIVLGEFVFLTIVGAVLGIPLGKGIFSALMADYESDAYRFPEVMDFSSIIFVFVALAACVYLSGLAAKSRVKKLDIVETLKTRE